MNRYYFLSHYSMPGSVPTFIISSPAGKVLLFHFPNEDTEIQRSHAQPRPQHVEGGGAGLQAHNNVTPEPMIY